MEGLTFKEMPSLSVDLLFESAAKIYLKEEQSISMTFHAEGISIRFPTTRRLAEYLEVPHYYILPYFGMMEEQKLVTRAERVGILTTEEGSKKLISIMKERYPEESQKLLGTVFQDLVSRLSS